MTYENWNLRHGDGVLEERVFCLTEEFIDLPALEEHILDSLEYPRRPGREWLVAPLEDVARQIDRMLCEVGFSYV